MHSAGEGLVVVYSRDSGTTRVLPPDIAALLVTSGAFRTLDEHAEAYARSRPVGRARIRMDLERLANDGLLVPEADEPRRGTAPPAIRWLAIPTCDRVPLVEETIEGYLANARAAGRDIEVIVADDAVDRDACTEMLRRLASRLGASISYAGLTEKEAFARLVAEAAGVPVATARFACLGVREHGLTTVGANRNAILWHAAGELALSVDDDVRCRLARGGSDRVTVTSHGGPLVARPFATREEALAAFPSVEADLLALHERWLGRDVREVAEGAGLDNADAATLRRVRTRQGRVAVTLAGIVGDCGWDNRDFGLLGADGTLDGTREWSQVAPSVVLTDRADPMFGWCLGLDGRSLLPPFTPLGRAEDVAFGVLLSSCFPGDGIVHLPWALLHAPPAGKAFSDEPPFAVGFNAWLPSVLASMPPHPGASAAARLAERGRAIVELGALAPREFEEFVRLHLLESLGATAAQVEARMDTAPTQWATAARAMLRRLRSGVQVPVEALCTLPGGSARTRELLLRYGEMLGCWPRLWEAARRLRADGAPLATPIAR